MTKVNVIKEAAVVAANIASGKIKQNVCVFHNDRLVALVSKQASDGHYDEKCVRNRVCLILALQMSKLKDKHGYDWIVQS